MRIFNDWYHYCSTELCSNDSIYAAGTYTNQNINEDYENGDILHFWYLCNQSSPTIQNFICGLDDLLEEVFPNEHNFVETVETDLSPLIHRYILVCHGDE